MGCDCSKEMMQAAQESCGQMKEHLTDMSTQIMGGEERQSGGIRLFDLHGNSSISLFGGLMIGIAIGSAVTACITRRFFRPWQRLARKQELQLQKVPMPMNRELAKSRLAELATVTQSKQRERRPSQESEDRTPAPTRRQLRRELERLRDKVQAQQVPPWPVQHQPSAPMAMTYVPQVPPQQRTPARPAFSTPGRPEQQRVSSPVQQCSSPEPRFTQSRPDLGAFSATLR